MSSDLYSSLGDCRSHAVPCRSCQRETFNISASCDRCRLRDEVLDIDEALADVECDRLASLEWRRV